MKKLKQIVSFLGLKKKVEDVEVLDLEIDSRKIKEGSAFLALKGTRTNGLKYMRSAQEAGAAAILYQDKNPPSDEDLEGVTIPVIKIPKDKKIGLLASWFYDNPSNKIGLIGITGTNGKSTITQLIAQWLSFGMDTKCAVLGTLGFGFLPDLQKSSNTTLDAVTLQKTLNQMVHQGAHYAALEVSSIGAVEGRIDGCSFSAAGYTNLTRDHLDYHKTMEKYAEAKLNFLKRVSPKRIVLNVDNEQGIKYSEELHGCVAYSCKSDFFSSTNSLLFNRYVWIKSATYKAHSIVIEVESSYGSGKCEIGLLGGFNVENFACALTVLLNLGFPLDKLLATASKLKPIKGRMECFTAEHKPHIVVDYAHTPDGVEQVLRGVREHHPDGEIWCVLGCGGDRDKGKRPIMAIKASVFADHAVFTSDNPRTEDPVAIVNQIEEGIKKTKGKYEVIVDRREAIKKAIEMANKTDIIVLAGKGHEPYQEINGVKHAFDERIIVKELISKMNKKSK